MSTYRFCKLLGHGGMGEVYLAVQISFGGFEKLIVIKRMAPLSRRDQYLTDQFSEEARLAACIRHPNVVEVLDIKQTGRELFIMMEYISGLTLRHVLTRAEGPIPIEMVCKTMADVAAGLAAGHNAIVRGERRVIVHGDVSPANIMLGCDGAAKVLDFGIAQVARSEEVPGPGGLGKAAYASPEQILNRTVGSYSDIWQLGVVAFELVTRRHPFAVEPKSGVFDAVLNGPISDVREHRPDTPAGLASLIARMLQRDRTTRPTGAEARDGFLELLGGMGVADGNVSAWLAETFPEEQAEREELEQMASAGTLDTREVDYLSDILASNSAQSVDLEPRGRTDPERRSYMLVSLAAVLVLLLLSGIVWTRTGTAPGPAPSLPPPEPPIRVAEPPPPAPPPPPPPVVDVEERAKAPPPVAPPAARPARKVRAPPPPPEPAEKVEQPPSPGPRLPTTDNIDPWAR